MFEQLEARGRALAERGAKTARARVRDAFPELEVSEEEGRVMLKGWGLGRRLLDDARLRWIGAWLR